MAKTTKKTAKKAEKPEVEKISFHFPSVGVSIEAETQEEAVLLFEKKYSLKK